MDTKKKTPAARGIERDLIAAAIRTAIDYARMNNAHALRDMGCKPEDIAVLKSMSIADMIDLCDANARASFISVSIEINHHAFNRQVNYLTEQREDAHLKEELMRHGASYHVLHSLWGISQAEYAALNAALGEPAKPGRPQNATELEAADVWNVWHEKETNSLSLARKLLRTTRKTNVAVATIWMLLQRWCSDGVMGGSDRELDAVMMPRSKRRPLTSADSYA